MNEVMHDTIDTVVAVASQFDAEETEDESVNVDAALGVTKTLLLMALSLMNSH